MVFLFVGLFVVVFCFVLVFLFLFLFVCLFVCLFVFWGGGRGFVFCFFGVVGLGFFVFLGFFCLFGVFLVSITLDPLCDGGIMAKETHSACTIPADGV